MCAFFAKMPLRILVVDDDIDLLMLLERSLTNKGYAVETAVSLAEAEEILPSFLPNLVLLDININGEDGRQLCWKLKHYYDKEIKVMIISGYDISKTRSSLFGADDLIPKPFYNDYLFERIQQVLGESEAVNK
jgi:DNA-binding response OmpR family regulator